LLVRQVFVARRRLFSVHALLLWAVLWMLLLLLGRRRVVGEPLATHMPELSGS